MSPLRVNVPALAAVAGRMRDIAGPARYNRAQLSVAADGDVFGDGDGPHRAARKRYGDRRADHDGGDDGRRRG